MRTSWSRLLGRGSVSLVLIAPLALAACSSDTKVTTGTRSSTSSTEDSVEITTDRTTDVTTDDTTEDSTGDSTEDSTDVSSESTRPTLPPITGSTVRPTTSGASTTTAAADEISAAGDQYLALAEVSNTAMKTVWGPYPDGVPWAEYPGVCAQVHPIETTLAAGLRAYTAWPAIVADDIQAMAALLDTLASLYQQCEATQGSDVASLRQIDEDISAAQDGMAPLVDSVRSKLNLPPAQRD